MLLKRGKAYVYKYVAVGGALKLPAWQKGADSILTTRNGEKALVVRAAQRECSVKTGRDGLGFLLRSPLAPVKQCGHSVSGPR